MRAALFITEHQRLSHAGRLYRQARKIAGVIDAFPTLGRYDGVAFLEAPSLDGINDAVVRISRLVGVHSTELHVETKTRAQG